ncbi:hypothetical protein D915_010774 [Fasciola hepatica]|uniref:RNMT-activating mini protein n=1 Tax=Fasciola hepatica TaxID=6192 RepID=A0A4E0QW01_FASHE|nr:hypothetical protein D915_010774 [Fasciola hepatica]
MILMDNKLPTLEELDQMFADRYTMKDDAYRNYCSQPISDPPVVAGWMERSRFEREDSRDFKRRRDMSWDRRQRDRSWHDDRR